MTEVPFGNLSQMAAIKEGTSRVKSISGGYFLA